MTIWNSDTDVSEQPLKVSDSGIKFLQFAPDGQSFVAGYGNGIFGRWPIKAGAPLAKPRTLSSSPVTQLYGWSGKKDLRFSNLLLPDRVPFPHELGENDWAIRGELLANIHEGRVLLWSTSRARKSPIDVGIQSDPIRYPFPYAFRDERKLIAVAPNRVTIAVTSGNGTISIRRGVDGDTGISWRVDVDAVDAMAFSPDGSRLAVTGCVEEIVLDPRKYYRVVKPRCVRN